MRILILDFFLLILGVLFNLTPDIVYKDSKFLKVFSQKSLKFVPSGGKGHVTFDPDFMLLSAEFDPIPEKRAYKKDAFVSLSSNGF